MTTHPTRRGAAVLAAAALLVTLAACGGAPATAPAAPAPAPADRTPEFCSALVQIESVFASSPPPEALPPEALQGVLAQQLQALGPLFTTAQETAPAEIKDSVDTLVETSTQSLSTGDFSGTESPAFAAAEDEVDATALADCGFEETSVTAVDFEFQGLPDSLPAGQSAVTLTNEGEDFHEIVLARINDDVTLPVADVLALPMEEALASVQLVGIVFAAPGESDTSFIDATPGRYVAACFLPEGTTPTTEGTGPPHFTLGMLREFTVA
ncbi:hypothetical protein [Pseudonocardia hydrocarbonoxydans]|uniref:Lipoprotein n=1 Tax=Pseudonocardia hydrocarbonoxydans TaxID=76726 RepID=A0A4Y3WR35_9PSEU|nr:hypothetical protein [Pseudonocardia hydrocarbonoxydans]GEC20958.1 hypothetical protein PHY01_32410 [Pseudonocardia hydrocarbonoxydans]